MQTRSFCYVDDLIDAMIKMMNNEKAFSGQIIIGNPTEIIIIELVETILRLKSKSKFPINNYVQIIQSSANKILGLQMLN